MDTTAKRPPPPPARTPPNQRPKPDETILRSLGVSRGVTQKFHKVVIYGPGGVGKTELCSLIAEQGARPLFLDLEEGSGYLDIARVTPTIETWDELRATLHNEAIWADYDAVVIDSLTKAEELATAWVIANVPHEKGPAYKVIKSIEDYGFGKGLTHNYEAFLHLLGDLDSHLRKNRHLICVAHECTANVPNPAGEDWIRYEPRLQSPASGKASIRHRVKEWCDHLVYVGFDTSVSKDGKATGAGTRTIYPTEMPTHWAKSRKLQDPIPYTKGDAEFWRQLLSKE